MNSLTMPMPRFPEVHQIRSLFLRLEGGGGKYKPNKAYFLIENPGNSGKNADLGSRGSGAISTVNIKRLVQKLRRTILFHFGLGTFRIRFGRTRKPINFMVFGPRGRNRHSQTNSS